VSSDPLIEYKSNLPVDLVFARADLLDPPKEVEIQSLMSALEKERLDRYRHEPSRICYLITRRLIRETLSTIGGEEPAYWRFAIGEHGRPTLANPTPPLDNIDFNIAHSRRLVVAGITKSGRVGVDIEPVDRKVDHEVVAERFFSDIEIEDLQKLEEPARRRRFLELWVLKEAWLKADGRGISAGLHRVIFRFDEGRARLEQLPDDDPGRWKVELATVDDHLLGLAWRR